MQQLATKLNKNENQDSDQITSKQFCIRQHTQDMMDIQYQPNNNSMVIGAANIVASPSKKDSTNIEGTHDELSNTQMINKQNKPINYRPRTMKQRNRRYSMLRKLWKQGFFQQDEIMLKFPLLYDSYVGRYKKSYTPTNNSNKFNSISNFLQSQVVSSQYRRILQQAKIQGQILKSKTTDKNRMKKGEIQSEQQQNQMEEQVQYSSNAQKQQTRGEQFEDKNEQEDASPYERRYQQIKEKDLQLQQQELIDYIQQEFIQGRLAGFDYEYIDNDDSLDEEDFKVRDQDEEQKYFDRQDAQMVEDPQNNTGVQDF